LNVLYNIKESLQWRTSYAKGFRAPQVFSKDIHARIAAGEVALVQLSDNLVSETSHSFLTSLDWSRISSNSEAGLTFEAFYTRLNDPFILEQISETIWEKRNGKGADVYGINLEAKYAPGQKWQFQGGATIQKALYDEAVQWSENIENTNANFFRSPNLYGNLMTTFSPKRAFQNNLTLVYTGSMYVPHFAGYIESDVLEKSSNFFEINFKSSYLFEVSENLQIQLSGGIQNILNSYQSDFDLGIDRDASYIYGPSRPHSFFIGLKFGTDLL
jgi:outer membrane receptor for ferrienterochelin and colicins